MYFFCSSSTFKNLLVTVPGALFAYEVIKNVKIVHFTCLLLNPAVLLLKKAPINVFLYSYGHINSSVKLSMPYQYLYCAVGGNFIGTALPLICYLGFLSSNAPGLVNLHKIVLLLMCSTISDAKQWPIYAEWTLLPTFMDMPIFSLRVIGKRCRPDPMRHLIRISTVCK